MLRPDRFPVGAIHESPVCAGLRFLFGRIVMRPYSKRAYNEPDGFSRPVFLYSEISAEDELRYVFRCFGDGGGPGLRQFRPAAVAI